MFDSIPFQQLWGSIFFASLSASRHNTFHHLLDYTVPYSDLNCYVSNCHKLIPLFLSVEAVCWWPLQGWMAVSAFQSLKCFACCLSLLTLMQVYPCARWSHARISNVGTSTLTGNTISAHCQNLSLPAIILHWNDHMIGADNMIFNCGVIHQMALFIIYFSSSIAWHLFIISRCLWL